MMSLEFTINSLNEKMCIGVIVVAAFILFERDTKDCLLSLDWNSSLTL